MLGKFCSGVLKQLLNQKVMEAGILPSTIGTPWPPVPPITRTNGEFIGCYVYPFKSVKEGVLIDVDIKMRLECGRTHS
jgi:hypothetical protein